MTRIAVLVDGDNLSADYADHILKLATVHGRIDVAQVYLNAARPSDWLSAPGYRAVHAGTGKNASDLLLGLDALELALSCGIEGFVIASSDGDFVHLAQRLRYHGHSVHGIGQTKAPMGFRRACSTFAVLPPLLTTKAGADAITEVDRNARALIQRNSRGGQGMRMADFGVQMSREFGARVSQMPERTWRAYLSARPALYSVGPKGPDAMVRFLPEGFALQ
ncbi:MULTISPECIES: NYN domain-containing protein [Ponticoccus]|uniref:NYN domain-containing protein n=1 Tax=Ponticoccus litoralis TaxID=422297 RepID=A0AAW9SQW7_9RHOB